MRSPEFIASRRILRPRLILTVLLIILLFAIPGGFYGLNLYADNLYHTLDGQKADILAFTIKVEPLTRMENEIRLLRAKAALEKEMKNLLTPWSVYLNSIRSAAPADLNIEQISANEHSELTIQGIGSTMQTIAHFNRNLEYLDFTDTVKIVSITMEPERGFRYVIRAAVKSGGGLP